MKYCNCTQKKKKLRKLTY
uniref:Uncharacterized protein n=1 Tax=Lepeophtheirus salmonis TaxID=72036 RepID=A0A0K2V7A8_LEPSM